MYLVSLDEAFLELEQTMQLFYGTPKDCQIANTLPIKKTGEVLRKVASVAKYEALSAKDFDTAEEPQRQPCSSAPISPGTTQPTLLRANVQCLFPMLNSILGSWAFDIQCLT